MAAVNLRVFILSGQRVDNDPKKPSDPYSLPISTHTVTATKTVSLSEKNIEALLPGVLEEGNSDKTVCQPKISTIARALTDPGIKAISFMPANVDILQTYYIEKLPSLQATPNYIGYIKPYFFSTDKHAKPIEKIKWGYINQFFGDKGDAWYPGPCHDYADSVSSNFIYAQFKGDPQTKSLCVAFKSGDSHLWLDTEHQHHEEWIPLAKLIHDKK